MDSEPDGVSLLIFFEGAKFLTGLCENKTNTP